MALKYAIMVDGVTKLIMMKSDVLDSFETIKACVAYKKMCIRDSHNALLFSNLGTIQRWQHRYEQALDSYTLALNIAPRAIPALMNRAALYLELGKDDLARIDYSLVLDIESDRCV